MHALVLGGSGQTGRHIFDVLVKQGHTATALVRNPDTFTAPVGVLVEKGTAEKREDVSRCFARRTPDFVFITLASSVPGLPQNCDTNVIEAMEEHGAGKVVYLSAYGVDDSFQSLNWALKFVALHSKLAKEFEEHKAAEQVLKRTKALGIRWVVVRPVLLREGAAAQVRSLGEHGENRKKFMNGITRSSVAQFMVDAAESREWDGKTPVICN